MRSQNDTQLYSMQKSIRSPRKKWKFTEREMLQSGLEKSLMLHEMCKQLPERTPEAVIRQAYELGYSVTTLEDGNKQFEKGIERRQKYQRKSSKTTVNQNAVLLDSDFENKIQNKIVAETDLNSEAIELVMTIARNGIVFFTSQGLNHTAGNIMSFVKNVLDAKASICDVAARLRDAS